MFVKLLEYLEEAGGSLDDYIQKVRDQFYAAWQKEDDRIGDHIGYAYVADVFEDHVIVVHKPHDSVDRVYYSVIYKIDGDGNIDFAAREDWEAVKLDYVPVAADSGDATAEGEVTEAFRGLVEATKNGPEAVIVVEGLSANGRYYTEAALKSGVDVFTGAKMYVDHPSRSEERDRPERSVRDLVGKLGEAYVGTDKNGNKALRAPMQISESANWLKSLVAEGIADGLSIRAYGSGKNDSQGYFVVEAFKPSPETSVDFVTIPAAGGYAELSESARGTFWEAITEDEIKKHRPDLLEADGGETSVLLIEGLDMTPEELKQLQESNQALLEENTRLFREVRTVKAEHLLEAALGDSLPAVVRDRIVGMAKPLVEAFATHGTETTEDQLTEAFSTLVAAEKAYAAKLMPNGAVATVTMEINETSVQDVEQQLEEVFSDILGDEDAAKIAVRGRK